MSELKHGFEVEWIPNVPIDEFGEADIDRAEFEYRSFPSKSAAHKFAKKILPKDFFGAVRIREFWYQEYDDDGIPFFDREYGPTEEVS